MNENLTEEKRKIRKFKQKQLWLYGSSGIGKTTLINSLSEGLRVYHIPNKDYYCGYNDDYYDVAVLDEYTGSKTLGWINQWLEGTPLNLDQKHKPSYVKKFNIPTIICSNLSPAAVYNRVQEVQLDALINRLEVIYADCTIDLEYVFSE